MTIFKKAPKKPAAPTRTKFEILRDKIDKASKEAALDWVSREFGAHDGATFSEESVRAKVERFLSLTFDQMIARAIGLEIDSWDMRKVRVMYNSPIKKAIEEMAKTEATKMVEKLFIQQEKKLPGALPPSFRKAVEKAYEEAYEDAVISAARTRGEERALMDIDKLLKSIGAGFPEEK
jgi:hypothetical protein